MVVESLALGWVPVGPFFMYGHIIVRGDLGDANETESDANGGLEGWACKEISGADGGRFFSDRGDGAGAGNCEPYIGRGDRTRP